MLEKKVYIATDYRKFGKAKADENELIRAWMPTTILQVLKNRVYGTLIQGRNQKHLFEGKKEKRLDEEHWTITEDAHEAIISLDTFEKVQAFPQNLIPLKIAEKKIRMLRMIQYLEENSIGGIVKKK